MTFGIKKKFACRAFPLGLVKSPHSTGEQPSRTSRWTSAVSLGMFKGCLVVCPAGHPWPKDFLFFSLFYFFFHWFSFYLRAALAYVPLDVGSLSGVFEGCLALCPTGHLSPEDFPLVFFPQEDSRGESTRPKPPSSPHSRCCWL